MLHRFADLIERDANKFAYLESVTCRLAGCSSGINSSQRV